MFISHRYQVIFIHIQRTGGYSIHDIFRQYDADLIESIPLDPNKQRVRHCYASDISDYLDPEVFKSYRKFCVVRHPYARMQSWYNVLKAGYGKNEPKMLTKTPVQKLYQKSIHYLNSHPNKINGIIANNLSLLFRFLDSITNKDGNFDLILQGENTGNKVLVEVNTYAKTFNDFLNLPRDKANGLFERFYTSQLDYISDTQGKILVDDILHLEDLDNDFNTFAEKVNFPGRLQHLNKSKNSSIKDKNIQNEIINKNIIKQRFEKDLSYFGYTL